MTRLEMKVKINSLKQGEQVSINGFDIKKLGTQWIVRKGDHIKKSFDLKTMDSAIEKILGEEVVAPITRKEKRAAKLYDKQVAQINKKNQKLIQKNQKIADANAVKNQKAAEKQFIKDQKAAEVQSAKDLKAERIAQRQALKQAQKKKSKVAKVRKIKPTAAGNSFNTKSFSRAIKGKK